MPCADTSVSAGWGAADAGGACVPRDSKGACKREGVLLPAPPVLLLLLPLLLLEPPLPMLLLELKPPLARPADPDRDALNTAAAPAVSAVPWRRPSFEARTSAPPKAACGEGGRGSAMPAPCPSPSPLARRGHAVGVPLRGPPGEGADTGATPRNPPSRLDCVS